MAALHRLSAAYHVAMASAFSTVGRHIARRPLWFAAAGIVAAIVLICGFTKAETFAVVDKLWRETGSRMDGEKAFYDEYFGGLGRDESVVFVSRTPAGVGSVEALDAILEGVVPPPPHAVSVVGGDFSSLICGRFAASWWYCLRGRFLMPAQSEGVPGERWHSAPPRRCLHSHNFMFIRVPAPSHA